MEHEAFYTSILTLKLGKEAESVVIKEVQRHPAKRQVMHMDLLRIRADEEITLDIPLHFVNEEISVGVKTQGGVVERLPPDVEVTCLPKDLPEYIEVDVSAVELDQILHLSDVKVPEGVTLVALEHGSEADASAFHVSTRSSTSSLS